MQLKLGGTTENKAISSYADRIAFLFFISKVENKEFLEKSIKILIHTKFKIGKNKIYI